MSTRAPCTHPPYARVFLELRWPDFCLTWDTPTSDHIQSAYSPPFFLKIGSPGRNLFTSHFCCSDWMYRLAVIGQSYLLIVRAAWCHAKIVGWSCVSHDSSIIVAILKFRKKVAPSCVVWPYRYYSLASFSDTQNIFINGLVLIHTLERCLYGAFIPQTDIVLCPGIAVFSFFNVLHSWPLRCSDDKRDVQFHSGWAKIGIYGKQSEQDAWACV